MGQATHDGNPLRLCNLIAPHPKTAHLHRMLDLILITLRLGAWRTHLKTAPANRDHLKFDAVAQFFQIVLLRTDFALPHLAVLLDGRSREFLGSQSRKWNTRIANRRQLRFRHSSWIGGSIFIKDDYALERTVFPGNLLVTALLLHLHTCPNEDIFQS